MRNRMVLLGALLLLWLSPAFAQADSRIVLQNEDNLLNMDPAILTSGADYAVAYLVYSGLVRHVPGTTQLEGDLAQSWDVSGDGLEYTFRLREGVQWHRGFGELTADDVVYSFQRIQDPAVGSRYLRDLSPIEAVEAVDRYTVRFVLESPYPGLLDAVLAYRPGFIVKREAIEQYGSDYVNRPVGTGPYVFENWTQGSTILLRRFADYFGPEPQIEWVDFRIIREDTVSEIALETGEIDGAYIQDPEVQARIVQNDRLVTYVRSMPRTHFMHINLQRDPFTDVRVRQAIAHAIDKQALVDFVFLGMGEVAHHMIPSSVFGYLDEPGLLYDPQRSRDLLADAGFPGGFSGATPFEIVTNVGEGAALALAMQGMLEDVGIPTRVATLERGLFQERRTTQNFDMLVVSALRVEPFQILIPYFHSDQAPYPNIGGYAGADGLMNEGQVETDVERRLQLLHETQRQITQDVPALSLLHPVQVLVTQPGVGGVAVGLLTYPVWQMTVPQR